MKTKADSRAEILIRGGCLLSVALLLCAFTHILANLQGVKEIETFLIAVCGFAIGYAIQAGASRLFRFKRREADTAYESNVKYFRFSVALPAICVAIVTFIISNSIFTEILIARINSIPGEFYEEGMLSAPLLAFALAGCMITGAVIWFLPTQRLGSVSYCFTGTALMLVFFFLNLGSPVFALYLAGYVILSVIVINQNVISKNYKGTVVSFITPRARFQNLAISGMVLIISAAGCLVFALMFTGISVLFLFWLYGIFHVKVDSEQIIDDSEQVGVGKVIAQKLGMNSDGLMYGLTILFTVVLIVIGFMFALRHTKEIKALIKRIKEFILSIFLDMWFGFFAVNKGFGEKPVNFVDDEKKIQHATINPYVKAAEKVGSYKDFLSRLKGFSTAREKLLFSYVTMTSEMRKSHAFLRVSDTPREAAKKLRDNSSYEGIEMLTSAFETVAYTQEGRASEDEMNNATEMICKILQKCYV